MHFPSLILLVRVGLQCGFLSCVVWKNENTPQVFQFHLQSSQLWPCRDYIPTMILSSPVQADLFKRGILQFQLGKYLLKQLFTAIEIQPTSKGVVENSCNLTSEGELSGGTLVSKF